MLIARLSAALVGGGYDDIIAIGLVANEEEGEFWFCNNKPTDGTQVDYVLHNIPEVFAASDLLAACKSVCSRCRHLETVLQAIAKAKP